MASSTNPRLRAIAKEVCRTLRKSQTPAEGALWQVLRDRNFHGLKFYRQHPLFIDLLGTETFFVADFFCFEKRIVIEVDGRIHDYQKEHDALRSFIINRMGIRVMRVNNYEVKNGLASVLEELEQMLFSDSRSTR